MVPALDVAAKAREFASECHVDIDYDIRDKRSLPILMPLDDRGRPLLHISEEDGVDYYISRIDYFNAGYRVAGSRLISIIMPGHRMRSAYLPSISATKVVEIHQGAGYLILGNRQQADEDFSTHVYPLNPNVTPSITISANHFYTIEAASWNHEPLVISEILQVNSEDGLRNFEIILDPAQDVITTPDGIIEVPDDFYDESSAYGGDTFNL